MPAHQGHLLRLCYIKQCACTHTHTPPLTLHLPCFVFLCCTYHHLTYYIFICFVIYRPNKGRTCSALSLEGACSRHSINNCFMNEWKNVSSSQRSIRLCLQTYCCTLIRMSLSSKEFSFENFPSPPLFLINWIKPIHYSIHLKNNVQCEA